MRADERLRSDERLTDGAPMRPLECGRCGANVLVRKASWQQTSVQWDARAVASCEERGPGAGAGGIEGSGGFEDSEDSGGFEGFEGCAALRASIREAALRGVIPVLDE